MNFAEFETSDRRLVMLRGLENAAQYRANAYLLRRYCAALGHAVSADRFEADLAWLAEQGLIERTREQEVTVATLTQRGLDVANGTATVPGVARPQPDL
jgi:hypothetical protein